MHVLVTGAAGFIGSHVARQFLDRGDRVTGIDNFNDYYDPVQKQANAAGLNARPGFRLIAADICQPAAMEQVFREARYDAVVHLAGYAGVRNSVANPQLYFDVNLRASLSLIELARHHQSGNFLFASTSSVYGNQASIPFQESDPCVLAPQPYAASKRAVEQIAYTYHQHYGLNFTALRFFTVYGPAGRPDMMPALLAESIHFGRAIPHYRGDFLRDWTFVEDIAAGVVAAADRPLGYRILNLGRGRPEPLQRFIELMEAFAGGRAHLVPTEAPATEMNVTFADIAQASQLLGYQPSVGIEEGVERYCRWYRDFHRDRLGGGSRIHFPVQTPGISLTSQGPVAAPQRGRAA